MSLSWSQIKLAINSALGTKGEKTIDEIVKEIMDELEQD